ncbi:hypothetical protein HHK36_026307 [Tetracentron sinense]|uniref:pectinesterase n=1 Tax=Tetracentron sinense TaxID=13715 RepID=A0A834YJ74_TETSI|nr:hypothetical protein HHK36_026307 [Tetracentron sinense]
MHFLQLFQSLFCMVLFTSLVAARDDGKGLRYGVKATIALTITVDQSGHGNFLKVQEAIDSIPPNNNNEKVQIPWDKPFINLEGESSKTTVIQWGDYGNAINSSTFSLFAENFVATNICFKQCSLNVTAGLLSGTTGYITAQGRNSLADNSGFVFAFCNVYGMGSAYLGRAYGEYSRVLFYKTSFSNIIVSEGWWAWDYAGREGNIAYSEVDCTGPGSDKSKRVKWEQNLNPMEVQLFIKTAKFIDQGRWLEKQPQH